MVHDNSGIVLEDGRARIVFSLRYLGMGLFISWLCCTHIVELYPGIDALAEQRDAITLGMRFGDVGMLVLLAVFAPNIHSIGNHMKPVGALAALTCVGTAVCAWVLVPAGASEVVLELAGAITALGGACLLCLWAQIYSRLNSTQAIVYGGASFVFSSLISFVIAVATPPYAVAFTSMLPILSFACAWVSLGSVDPEPVYASSVRYPVPWKLIAIMGLAALISVVSGTLLPNVAGGSILRNAATGACGAILLAMAFTLRERCDIRLLARIAFPLALFTVLLIPFANQQLGTFVSFTGKLAYVWFAAFVLLVMCGICRQFDVPSLRMFATARACSEFAILLGVLVKREFWDVFQQPDPAFQAAFVFVGLVLLGLSVRIWVRESTVNSDWGAAGIVVETGLPEETAAMKFEARLDELASAHNLTAREKEMLELIAQGKTRSDICSELFLSENTVKTHARNLYKKLGVHSKAEVAPLFE